MERFLRVVNMRGPEKLISWAPRWLSGKKSTCNARDAGLIPRLGKSPGEGKGNPLWYSCLGSPMGRGAMVAAMGLPGVRHDLATEQHQEHYSEI